MTALQHTAAGWVLSADEPMLIAWRCPIQPRPYKRALSRGGQRWTDHREAAYRLELQTLWANGRRRGRLPRTPIDVPIAVAFTFAGTSSRKRNGAPRPDLSNLVKSVEDAGNGVLWTDDRLIVELHASMTWGIDVAPFVAVEAWAV